MAIINPLNQSLRALRTLQCPYHVQPADDGKSYRVTSGAFVPGTDGTFSVDLEESLAGAGLAVDARYPSLPKSVGLISHTIAEYEEQQFTVEHDPVKAKDQQPANDHHGSVSTKLKNKALRNATRAMAASARFVVAIDPENAVALGAKPLSVQTES